jgi:hypothetical protein
VALKKEYNILEAGGNKGISQQGNTFTTKITKDTKKIPRAQAPSGFIKNA